MILRSQQQAKLPALLHGEPELELELSVTDMADRTGIPSARRDIVAIRKVCCGAHQQLGEATP